MLADVARVAEVSVPTVSRVLKGSPPVSQRKRDRVLAAVQELGYRPNGAARMLVTGRRTIVSVITSNTTRFGYATSIQGIEEAARTAGLLVAITVIDPGGDAEVAAVVDLVLGQPVAGVIVLDFDPQGTRAIEALPEGLPIAAVGSSDVGRTIPRALFDDRLGGREATQYLLGLGHATVHHVSVPGSGRPSGRTLGWRSALESAGAVVPDTLEADWTSQSGYEAGLVLARTPDVTAVLCGNDEIAFGVVKALQVSGLRIPEDVSVVGFDDHPLAALWTPPLTTMGQDFVELGRTAMAFIVEQLEEGPGPQVNPSSIHLIERESSGPPPKGSAAVRRARPRRG